MNKKKYNFVFLLDKDIFNSWTLNTETELYRANFVLLQNWNGQKL